MMILSSVQYDRFGSPRVELVTAGAAVSRLSIILFQVLMRRDATQLTRDEISSRKVQLT